ncbi:MAG: hypothetical protein RLZZ227_627 [Pseudomonadota bacterium]|jgi:uncharacterized protein YgfB (UPF0149 family)
MQADYKMMSLLLQGNHVSQTPAQVHGLLTGQLCSGVVAPDPEDLAGLMEQPQHLVPVVCKLIDCMLGETTEQLAHFDYEFHPLLPSDEASLQERVNALGSWCDAFMVGFSAGYIRPDSALSPEAREILGDLGQFATISDDGQDLSDQDEVDYMELVEYVRVASITLFQQFGAQPVARSMAEPELPPDDGFIH